MVLSLNLYVPYSTIVKTQKETLPLINYLDENKCFSIGVKQDVAYRNRGSEHENFLLDNEVGKDVGVPFVKFNEKVTYICNKGYYNIESHYFTKRYSSNNLSKENLEGLLKYINKPKKSIN